MLAPKKLILASASPRRQEMLRQAGIEFEVNPAHISEDQKPGEPPIQYALRLAEEKAMKVAQQFPDALVLGADTIVVLDGEILGKPSDHADAARMLALLSGRTHQVTTAVSIIGPDQKVDTRSLTTQVEFRSLEQREIQEYVAGGEPMDKAGAYAIQGGAARWVTRLEGDYSNVVGLPLALVTEMLRTSGFLQS
jgi:septum formation protein